MNRDSLRALLEGVRNGQVDIDQAMSGLSNMPYEDLGFARIDHHRAIRRGQPEVIFCPGKLPEQVAAIAFRLVWGFVGSTHARFRDFAYGPGAATGYLRDLVRGRADGADGLVAPRARRATTSRAG